MLLCVCVRAGVLLGNRLCLVAWGRLAWRLLVRNILILLENVVTDARTPQGRGRPAAASDIRLMSRDDLCITAIDYMIAMLSMLVPS